MRTIQEVTTEISTTRLHLTDVTIHLAHAKEDLAGRLAFLAPAAGWLAENTKATEKMRATAEAQAAALDQLSQKLTAEIRDYQDLVTRDEAALKNLETEFQGIRWEVRSQMNRVLTPFAPAEDGSPEAPEFDRVMESMEDRVESSVVNFILANLDHWLAERGLGTLASTTGYTPAPYAATTQISGTVGLAAGEVKPAPAAQLSENADQVDFDAKVAAAHVLAQAALSGLKLRDGTPVSPAALAEAVFPSETEKESIAKTGHAAPDEEGW